MVNTYTKLALQQPVERRLLVQTGIRFSMQSRRRTDEQLAVRRRLRRAVFMACAAAGVDYGIGYRSSRSGLFAAGKRS
jgi:hypothetical protein